MRIKNWKLALLALLVFCLLLSLGFWQLSRAQQKKIEITKQDERLQKSALTANDLNTHSDLQYYQAELEGRFDSQHTFLLDNKIHEGKVGYEVYTLFHAKGVEKPILIDRGFIAHRDRNSNPLIPNIEGETHITGMLTKPPGYVSFGEMKDNNDSWPLRVEFINLSQLNDLLKVELFPLILRLQKGDGKAFSIEWQTTSMPPERHIGYAVQWFALAFTLLILFVALNLERKQRTLKG